MASVTLRELTCGTGRLLLHRARICEISHLRTIVEIAKSRASAGSLARRHIGTAPPAAAALESPGMPQTRTSGPQKKKRTIFSIEWNFVWAYIILLGLIGSQNMNIMRQKHVYKETERLLSKKIDALESVIERIKNGEDVDIAEELGTGMPSAEREWKELLASLEDQEAVWRNKAIREVEKVGPRVEEAEEKVMDDIKQAVSASEKRAEKKTAKKQPEKTLPKNVFL
ncbi:hypothetical protein V1506DRAFT_529608 [Lipomyces tetrasporus]